MSHGVSIDEAIASLLRSPSVEYAEPNWKVNFLAKSEPDDPAYQDGTQWYLDTASRQGYIGTSSNTFEVDVDIDAPEAWGVMSSTFNSSMRVSVGVLDSGAGEAGYFDNSVGYIPNHEDLFNSLIFVNPNEWASGSDSDSNGFVDDINGWNWVEDNNTPADSPTDPSAPFHGTLISGIIAAAWNNGTGIAGIGVDSLHLLPLRIEFLDEILEGIDYAISFAADGDPPVAVLNASWTINDSLSLRDAIVRAGNAGIVFVAAAGNISSGLPVPNNDVVPVYPASYSTSLGNVLSVAASDPSGGLAGLSHFGVNSVQIAAPGELIHSTYSGTNQYKSVDGTSFSAPIAASALGLIMAADPSLAPSEAIARLLNGGDFHARLSGLVTSQKRVNLAGALAPFNPYSDLVLLGTTRSIAMYSDSIGAQYATFTSWSSSDPSVAVLVGDSTSGWAVSPIRPGIATFTLSFSSISDPVASYETGTWRVTGIAPFTAQLQLGDKVTFTSLLPGAPSWDVTNSTVGTIDGNGEFTALTWGQTQVVLSVNGIPEDNSGMIVIDQRTNQLPSVTISSGPDSVINSTAANFVWAGSDPDGSVSGYYRSLDAPQDPDIWTTATSWTVTNLGYGSHTFYIKSEDDLGDTSPIESWAFTVNRPPTISITSGPSGTINDTTATFQWSGQDSDGVVVRYHYSMDDPNPTIQSSETLRVFTNLSEGLHAFYLKAEDNNGSFSDVVSNSFTVVIDKTSSDNGGGGGGCFIATAAYGSYEAPAVKLLRDFRDEVLLKTAQGRMLVDAYYLYSPPVAKWLENSNWAKSIVRILLLPLIALAWFLLKLSLPIQILAIILLVGMISFTIRLRRRNIVFLL